MKGESKILVTGANGQLGSEIKVLVKNNNHYICTNKEELNITNKEAIATLVKQNHIELVINCAAYTYVDKAEEDSKLANAINKKAVQNIAEVCNENNIALIHISTDYVFEGIKNTPYKEDDKIVPLGVYGKTKWQGEEEIRKFDIDYLILRTSWLYSSFGNNFVKTILKLSSQKNEINVVNDQIGTPTYAKDLAEVILFIAENQLFKGKREIYHFANKGACSWYEFAKEIIHQSKEKCVVNPIKTSEFPTLAKRPQYSVLNTNKIEQAFGVKIRTWQKALGECLKNKNI